MPGEAVAEVKAKLRLGVLALDAEFASSAPWTVLFGPSGSGKSTLLRVMAGLTRPREGRIVLRGRTVLDTAAGIWAPAHGRAVRWAGQRAALFPNRTVRENVAMGLGHGDEAEAVLRHFGLVQWAARRPAELSGGERQRVSVVRAAGGARGGTLLLDEPFAGMDTSRRDELIEQLEEWLGTTPVVSVTHDVGEAFRLRAEVVRIDGGRVTAQGPVERALKVERERLRETISERCRQ